MSHIIDILTMPRPTRSDYVIPDPGAYEFIDRENGNIIGLGTFESMPAVPSESLVGRRVIDPAIIDRRSGLPVIRTVTRMAHTGAHETDWHVETKLHGNYQVAAYLCLLETL